MFKFSIMWPNMDDVPVVRYTSPDSNDSDDGRIRTVPTRFIYDVSDNRSIDTFAPCTLLA